MNQDQKFFSIDELYKRVELKLGSRTKHTVPDSVRNVQMNHIVQVMVEVLCEEINEIRRELRRKI